MKKKPKLKLGFNFHYNVIKYEKKISFQYLSFFVCWFVSFFLSFFISAWNNVIFCSDPKQMRLMPRFPPFLGSLHKSYLKGKIPLSTYVPLFVQLSLMSMKYNLFSNVFHFFLKSKISLAMKTLMLSGQSNYRHCKKTRKYQLNVKRVGLAIIFVLHWLRLLISN